MAKYSRVKRAIFVRRPNRFIAVVNIDGKEEVVHVKNTGRCKELLVPGSVVYLEKTNNPLRKTQYDLICPSDYTIQKMLNEDLLIKFDMNEDNLTYKNVENYNKYASPYIKELFIEKGWQEYSIPYMWGTMGIIYNIDTVENHEDMHTFHDY